MKKLRKILAAIKLRIFSPVSFECLKQEDHLKILRWSKLCHGCRACELMCSFHHRKAFSPQSSSIHLIRDNATGTISWSVDATCDGCDTEAQPFCEKYCLYGALRRTA